MKTDTDTRPPYYSPLGFAVNKEITRIHRDLSSQRPSVRAELAYLRKALGKPVGSVPEVWAQTIGLLADNAEPQSAYASAEEVAVHAAMTLFASHQQGRSDAVHRPGMPLGRAIRNLVTTTGADSAEDNPVRRRFDKIITASGPDEAVVHLRGIIQSLRAAQVPLDYALLAQDLHSFAFDDGRHNTRLKWARQYYRTTTTTTNEGK